MSKVCGRCGGTSYATVGKGDCRRCYGSGVDPVQPTDNASAVDVLKTLKLALIHNDPDERPIGDIRACDIVRAIGEILATK